MNFDQYRVEDFLKDKSFYNWVQRKNQRDINFWESWWEEYPQHHIVAGEAKQVLETLGFRDRGFSEDEVEELWSRIKVDTSNAPRVSNSRHQIKQGGNYFLKVAAVLLPFIVCAGLFFYVLTKKEASGTASELVIKEVPRGQKLTIYLPDGSRVKLNSESTLSYTQPFDTHERLVKLQGEAFFEVTPNTERPFKVISGDIATTVLGTSFNISAYSDEEQVSVAVVTGKVLVANNAAQTQAQNVVNELVLSPSEQVTYFQGAKEAVVTDYNPKQVLAWNEGILYFDNASMEEFVSELERWYGIDIVVERTEPIQKGVVGEFKNQSLEEIMMGMHGASEFDYAFSNGKLFIK